MEAALSSHKTLFLTFTFIQSNYISANLAYTHKKYLADTNDICSNKNTSVKHCAIPIPGKGGKASDEKNDPSVVQSRGCFFFLFQNGIQETLSVFEMTIINRADSDTGWLRLLIDACSLFSLILSLVKHCITVSWTFFLIFWQRHSQSIFLNLSYMI